MPRLLFVLTAFLSLSAISAHAEEPRYGLRVPEGFEVTEFADSGLANDIFCMTLDPQGRVVVSGRGYIRLLTDDGPAAEATKPGTPGASPDRPTMTGRASKALDFAGAPKDGAMGLFWEGDDLYCMGDGGLRRYSNAGGEGRLRPPELLYKFKTGGEHDAHAIRRGPDGWLYVLCGNSTGINKRFATAPTSPIENPVAGCVLRFSADFKRCEIVADGFRNAYSMDFNRDGELFTFDSDNERCVSLPWYEPTRLYHVVPGGHHGWQNPQHAVTWRFPPYFLDVVAPVATFGRGSPTGVVCYKHTQFPAEYRGGLFLLDWTFGRIYFASLKRAGSSYTAESKVFLQAVGDNGFAPTAAAVHPLMGDLFVSIGGRGTRGAVYRIRYPKGVDGVKPDEVAKWQPAARSLEWKEDSGPALIEQAARGEPFERLHALTAMLRHREHFDAAQLEAVVKSNAGSSDRALCQTTAALVAHLDERDQERLVRLLRKDAEVATVGLGRVSAHPAEVLEAATRLLSGQETEKRVRLDAVRLIQLAVGDVTAPTAKGTVWEGYTRRQDSVKLPEAARKALREALASHDTDLAREAGRTLAMVEDESEETVGRVSSLLDVKDVPVDTLHHLIVLARLRGARSRAVTERVTTALLGLDRSLVAHGLKRDSNWPLRVAELHAELARKDANLNAALLAHPDFGRPDHVLFTQRPGFDRQAAAEKFFARIERDADYPWNAALVELIGGLPPERSLPVLRKLWGQQGLDETILPVLAREAREKDRGKFLEGLSAARTATVRAALDALEKLPRPMEIGKEEIVALVLALRRLPEGKDEDRLRQRIEGRLRQGTKQELASAEAWAKWCVGRYPDVAPRLKDADGVDVEAWERRLAALDWTAGDAERGRAVFTKASCAACHSGAQALGPDLHGAAGRFSRADLFTAILRPSKDVAPRYRTTLIATADGKVYQGLIVYEAVDSVILQTGPATTLRLTNQQIAERRQTALSLMPSGLLDRLSDREIADLYAHLKEMKGPAK
jgi:putative heme-binding domain-containing protein